MAARILGEAVLATHLGVIAFNIFGLVAIPLGAVFGWPWVRIRWGRTLHLLSLGVVALQALLGRACFLTLWQDTLTGAGRADPLIMRWVNSVIYWPLPIWVFTAAYLAIFGYTVLLWRWVAPVRNPRA